MMPSNSDPVSDTEKGMPPAGGDAVLDELVRVAVAATNGETMPFISRLCASLLAMSEASADPKEIRLSFNAANLLNTNPYPFQFLLSDSLTRQLKAQILTLSRPSAQKRGRSDGELALVGKEELDQIVRIGNVGRMIESAHVVQLSALDVRLAHLLAMEDLSTARNPFRPEVFVAAACEAWSAFNPDAAAHSLLLNVLKPEVFVDLGPIMQALNGSLVARGVLPDLADAYRILKARGAADDDGKRMDDAAVKERLRQLLCVGPASPAGGGGESASQAASEIEMPQGRLLNAAVVNQRMLGYLASLQKEALGRHRQMAGRHGTETDAMPAMPDTSVFADIKARAPQGAFSRTDEAAIDLLTHVFDIVFREEHIPLPIKALIATLQVPILKAALVDKNFFVDDGHPARRLIGLLAQSGLACNQTEGAGDPLYRHIERNVQRVQQDFSEQLGAFANALSDIESFLQQDQDAVVGTLAEPIGKALQEEKVQQATKTARNDVALRIGTGEVAPFVEAFLERKWVSVLTFAYTVQDEKPQAVPSALQTMDDLIWSIKPKITREQRKELIAKLPSMLTALNQWISVIEWDDAERLQFFAELAECHASIVRAPLELSPKRQLEIAVEAAKQAAARRLQRRAGAQAEQQGEADDYDGLVAGFERGVWIEFMHKDSEPRQLRLAWVSPLRSLYVFSTRERKESLSISAEDLAKRLRKGLARVVQLDGLVSDALAKAVGNVEIA